MGRLARALLAIPLAEVRVDRRGFRVTRPDVRERLEAIGEAFVSGYHAALETPGLVVLERALAGIDNERRGFAYEGAAMALAVIDAMARWRAPRWREFLDGPGEPHAYMVHVGAGWAMARVGPLARRVEQTMDPLLRPLAYDGFGFHEAYFHAERYSNGQRPPAALEGDQRHAFDQGLGRGFWFVESADPARVAQRIETFADERRDDLWSGVGLACAYAGSADAAALADLRASAGDRAPWMAQGAAFAAKARLRAGNPAPHTRAACEALAALDDIAAARVTDEALVGAPDYEQWRRRIRDQLASGVAIGDARPIANGTAAPRVAATDGATNGDAANGGPTRVGSPWPAPAGSSS
jgi:enediyne biosynthesis protein E3